MSFRLIGHIPNVNNGPNKSDDPIIDIPIPTGTIKSWSRRFYTLPTEVNLSSEDPNLSERELVSAATEIPDFQKPVAHSFVFHSCGRYKRDTAHTDKSGPLIPRLLQPSCRKSFSMGHLCNKFGLTEIHSSSGQHISNTIKENRFNSPYDTLNDGGQPGTCLRSTTSAGPLDGFQKLKIYLYQGMEMPAPEDIADIVISVQLPLGLQLIAPPVAIVFVEGACVRCLVALRKLMPAFRVLQVLSLRGAYPGVYLLLGQTRKLCQAFTKGVSCSKHGSQQSTQALGPGYTSDKHHQAEAAEKSDSNARLPSVEANIAHRHHTAAFHGHHHITEHLSSAVGHNAYDLLEDRNEKKIQPVFSKRNIKRSPYLEPFTKPKSVTSVNSFQWTQESVPPCHPNRSVSRMERRSPATEVAVAASGRQPQQIANEKSTHNTRSTMSEGSTVYKEKKEAHNDSGPSWRNIDTHKFRLINTPPWLKNPTKEAADATAPLYHVKTKSHEEYGHGSRHVPNIAVGGWRGHADTRTTSPAYKANSLKERHVVPARIQGSSLLPETPEISHTTPQIQIDKAPSGHNPRGVPISVLQRREIFESGQGYAEMASSAKKASPNRKTLPQRAQRRGETSTAQSGLSQPDQEPRQRHLFEQSSGPEIANPTPIAPPNHACTWKERYLALTAEIRQLKAEMSAQTSLKSSDILTPRYEEREDNINLLGLTVIMHFRDRDDIVINTDAA
ncbi:hypothetical protein NUW58_g1732 [Xylaria curta]|uniref:Uncharacterized protein n=1 Tax=Xylaria curta TaxID=42375 RepID=A0ACC1PLQ9_9PEZI|nr:hypothetical protein NUW58_g1732 [Xylaria curta]